MRPIRKNYMSFDEIASQWNNGSGYDNIMCDLLSAFWLGDLKAGNIDREGLLEAIRNAEGHPYIYFHNQDNFKPITYCPDGSVEFIKNDIKLPKNKAEWKKDDIGEAYQKLSKTKLSDYAEVCHPVFYGTIQIDFDSFREWCEKNKWEYEDFWCPLNTEDKDKIGDKINSSNSLKPKVKLPPVPKIELSDYLKTLKDEHGGIIPTMISSEIEAKNKFTQYRVTRRKVREVHKIVFPNTLPGPRKSDEL